MIAIIAILAGMLLPALGRAKKKAQAISCMSNSKQLVTGFIMWALDNDDLCLHSWGGTDPNGTPPWCRGSLGGLPDAIDETIIQQSATYQYVSSLKVFRCPSDRSTFTYRGEQKPRIRSYSMNGYLGYPGGTVPGNCPPFKSALKMSQITRPGPSDIFVFLDEHENTINDSHFTAFSSLTSFPGAFLDTPSGRHGNATGFAYADGRAEVHKWVDSEIQVVKYGPGETPPYIRLGTPGPRDFIWWTNHTASFAQ